MRPIAVLGLTTVVLLSVACRQQVAVPPEGKPTAPPAGDTPWVMADSTAALTERDEPLRLPDSAILVSGARTDAGLRIAAVNVGTSESGAIEVPFCEESGWLETASPGGARFDRWGIAADPSSGPDLPLHAVEIRRGAVWVNTERVVARSTDRSDPPEEASGEYFCTMSSSSPRARPRGDSPRGACRSAGL